MIEIQGGIEIGPGIYIGEFPGPGTAVYFITESSEYLITENDEYLIEE